VNAPDWRLMRATPFFARAHSGLLRSGERHDVILAVNGFRTIWDYQHHLPVLSSA
jgi:hypothetical protein